MDSDGAAPWHPAARLGSVGSKDFLGMESYWPFFQSQFEGTVVFFSNLICQIMLQDSFCELWKSV